MIWSKISSTSVLRCQVEFFQVSFECAFDREGLLRQWVRSLPPHRRARPGAVGGRCTKDAPQADRPLTREAEEQGEDSLCAQVQKVDGLVAEFISLLVFENDP